MLEFFLVILKCCTLRMKYVSVSIQKYKLAAFDPSHSLSLSLALPLSHCVAHTPLKGEVDLFCPLYG